MYRFFFLFLFFPCALHAFWPVSWGFNNERRFLGPLVSYEKEDDATRLTLRPFLFSYDSKDGGVYDYLYPLGKSSKEKSYFIPFFLSKEFEGKQDTALFPFFYGESKRGSYFGVFPLFGNLYDRFGRDEINFFMWPLYSRIKDEEATKTNILWPIFSFYGGKEEGFKAWPIYGYRNREGVKNTSFFLWPIFIKEEKNLDTDEPVDNFYAFPFYIHSISRTKASYHVLWPLFSYSRDDEKTKKGMLFSLFSLTEGKETKGYSFFPFIYSETKGRDHSFGLLWPIYKESEWYVRDERFMQKNVLLFNRYIEDDRGTFFNVWPFFEYSGKGGDFTFLFPSLLPFRVEGFDRIIKPLFTLYEQRKREEKHMVSLLFGLYTREREGDNWKTRFAFLFEVKRDEGGLGFEFLSGLFGIDSKQVKILFIPFKRGQEAGIQKVDDPDVFKPIEPSNP